VGAGMAPLVPHGLEYGDKPLCATLDGFTLHAATRGRSGRGWPRGVAPLRASSTDRQERLERRPDGLVRITLKRAWADGTVAVVMAPLSLL
jgi:hypothetical protein